MPRSIQKAKNVMILGVRLYRELALSALTLLPGRRDA